MLDWRRLALLPDAVLGLYDIAEVNLACAADLPDAGAIDAPQCLRTLDEWSDYVGAFTRRMMPKFRREPHDYRHSEGYFRTLCMITALQLHLGVRYNLAKIPIEAVRDTADVFVHGAILGEGGTCSSLPVLYVAVGRRLGYPLKLVPAMVRNPRCGHLFARWDDPRGERFNVEGTNRGLSSHSDDYYRTGLYEITLEQEWKGCLLRSLTPRQELSNFLAEQAFRWLDLGDRRRAAEAFAWAFTLHPENRMLWNTMCRTINDWALALERREPPGFPPLRFPRWMPRRFPESLPQVVEDDILFLEAADRMLKDRGLDAKCWEPLRLGCRPGDAPAVAHVEWR